MGLGVSACSNVFINHASCIPSLSCLPFFLYHPYMPLFYIHRIFNLLVLSTTVLSDICWQYFALLPRFCRSGFTILHNEHRYIFINIEFEVSFGTNGTSYLPASSVHSIVCMCLQMLIVGTRLWTTFLQRGRGASRYPVLLSLSPGLGVP